MEGLDEFIGYLQRISDNLDNIITESLEETATMVIADTKENTPVKTGALKRSWTHEEVEQSGDKYTLEVGSSLIYAPFIESGHRQGTGYVQGRFMLKDAMEKNREVLQRKINEKLNNLR